MVRLKFDVRVWVQDYFRLVGFGSEFSWVGFFFVYVWSLGFGLAHVGWVWFRGLVG